VRRSKQRVSAKEVFDALDTTYRGVVVFGYAMILLLGLVFTMMADTLFGSYTLKLGFKHIPKILTFGYNAAPLVATTGVSISTSVILIVLWGSVRRGNIASWLVIVPVTAIALADTILDLALVNFFFYGSLEFPPASEIGPLYIAAVVMIGGIVGFNELIVHFVLDYGISSLYEMLYPRRK